MSQLERMAQMSSGSSNCTPQRVKRRPLGELALASPFEVPSSPFMKKLGSGTGVCVYRLQRANKGGADIRSPWAVKKVTECARANIQDRLAKEASILKELDHPNIVGFRGITGNAKGDFCLLMEDCEKSLMDLIEEKAFLEESFGFREVLSTAWGIARALEYLHERRILHADLKSGNILIRGNFQAVKLCDFGVSVRLKEDLSDLLRPDKDRYTGSEPWKPKEALNRGAITDKADVFAYGLIIWEMFTLSVPHVDLLHSDTDSSCTLSTDRMTCDTDTSDEEEDPEEYLQALGTRPPLPAENFPAEFTPLIELFVCCTHEDPALRPSAAQVVQCLAPLVKKHDVNV